MRSDQMQDHIFHTYISMRYGMAVLSFVFPVLLYILGGVKGLPLQESMSAYYFATPCAYTETRCEAVGPESGLAGNKRRLEEVPVERADLILFPTDKWSEPSFPMRVWFVGLLFSIGAFLYLYKGFSKRENIALNLAGMFAWGVALFPMNKDAPANFSFDRLLDSLSMHGACAVFLFICLIYVVRRCAGETLELDTVPEEIRRRYRRYYKWLGIAMIAFIPSAIIATLLLTGGLKLWVFAVEAFGVWTFALYWFTKSRELAKTRADKEILTGALKF